jgi:phage shock protein E
MNRFYSMLLLVAFTSGFTQSVETVVSTEAGTYLDLTPEAFQARLESQGNYLLINTHVPYEGELPGTELFLPFDQVEQLKDLLPRDKTSEILVYCRSGRMSTLSAETLVKLGYTNVKNLAGGMIAWEQAGYMIETLP